MKGSLKRSMGKPLREKISAHIFSLKGFPIVPMSIHRDACNAGLLNDLTECKIIFFFESSKGLSDPEP